MSSRPAPPGWLRALADRSAGLTAAALGLPSPPAGGARRRSAVLVLVGEGDAGADLLLIERAASLRHHAGQAAFPGGAVDPGDDGPVGAALREAREETGIDPAGVDVLAVLPPLYLSVSGYEVVPVLGWWREPGPVGAVDPGEVASVHRVPLAQLADPDRRFRAHHPRGHLGPAFAVDGLFVWGFTAAVLDRLLALSGWQRPWDPSRVVEVPGAPAVPPADPLPAPPQEELP